MAVTCCQTCTSHGQSLVDFSLDGNGEASEKPTDSTLRGKISHQTQFSFPVPGFSEQEKYGVDLGYWPLVQTPGVAYVVNTDVGTSPSDALSSSLASCWPAVLLVFVMSLLAGFLMWILVSYIPEETPIQKRTGVLVVTFRGGGGDFLIEWTGVVFAPFRG